MRPERDIMPANPSTPREAAPARGRTITTILLIMLAILIIRDVFARRWGAH
jgi:hypothetical protein